jgi:hypothetical protein
MNKKVIFKRSAKFFENESQKIIKKLAICKDKDQYNIYHAQLEAIKVRIKLELKLIDEFIDDEDEDNDDEEGS